MKRILVLRGGALGDFIVTLPALALLRARWPDARIDFCGNATAARLALHRRVIDAAHSQHEARWSALFGSAPLPPEFAAWLREFDLVINYWPDPDGELRRRFPLRDEQAFLSAPAMPTLAPAAAHYCAPLRALGIEARDYLFRVQPLSSADPRPAPRAISVHPGSGSPRKNWPLENWLELIPRLPGPVTVILGEAEVSSVGPALAAGPRSADKRKPCILASPALEDLITHLAGCRLFLGHDSGVSHLAAACGVPCVLVFGPTEKAMWAPPAPNVLVLQRGSDPRSVSVDDVTRAAVAALSDQR